MRPKGPAQHHATGRAALAVVVVGVTIALLAACSRPTIVTAASASSTMAPVRVPGVVPSTKASTTTLPAVFSAKTCTALDNFQLQLVDQPFTDPQKQASAEAVRQTAFAVIDLEPQIADVVAAVATERIKALGKGVPPRLLFAKPFPGNAKVQLNEIQKKQCRGR